jgi:preprotein translocase subunit SecB
MIRTTGHSPLQLDAVQVSKLSVIFNEEALFGGTICIADSADQYEIGADFDVRHTEGELRKHWVTLELVLRSRKDAEAARFKRLEIKLHGIFTPTPGFSEDVICQVIPGNCLAILHGIARGIVIAATSSCCGGPFLLPIINYQDLIEKKLRAIKRQTRADAQDSNSE